MKSIHELKLRTRLGRYIYSLENWTYGEEVCFFNHSDPRPFYMLEGETFDGLYIERVTTKPTHVVWD